MENQMQYLLTALILLPLIGAGLILLLIQGDEEIVAARSRMVALFTSTVTFVVSLALWFYFDRGEAGFQFVHAVEWFSLGNVTLPYRRAHAA